METDATDHRVRIMCRRVIQSSAPIRLAIVEGLDVRDSRVHNFRRDGMRQAKTSGDLPQSSGQFRVYVI
jgi:hypothetical protein